MEGQPDFNPENIWGGNESDWVDWRAAKREMDLKKYFEEQAKEILSEKTRAAFKKTHGDLSIEPNEDMLGSFFTNYGGSVFFKRRNLQFRRDVDFAKIKEYYENKLWEKELEQLSLYQK